LTRRRGGKNAEKEEWRPAQDKAETAEKRGLTPGAFPGKLAPISECSGRPASIGCGRWEWKYSASEPQNSTETAFRDRNQLATGRSLLAIRLARVVQGDALGDLAGERGLIVLGGLGLGSARGAGGGGELALFGVGGGQCVQDAGVLAAG